MLQRIERVQEILRATEASYFRPCFSCSFSAESIVLLDLIMKNCSKIEVFTLDTGRLHDSTYAFIAEIQHKYGLIIKTYYPDTRLLEQYVNSVGQNAFYSSVNNRRSCCSVRKVEPLQRALRGKDAWVTGLRREQSESRQSLAPSEWVKEYELQKINPILDWSYDQVWEYVRYYNLPYNKLYDQGYTSIGCSPCTRPVTQGEDERAGRWWWEHATVKECGLHLPQIKSA